MLARSKTEIVRFNIYKVIVLIAFLNNLDRRLLVLLVYCSLSYAKTSISIGSNRVLPNKLKRSVA